MKKSRQVMYPRFEDTGNPATRATDRPLKIRVVFDNDVSAHSAEVLIKHVTSGLEYDTRSFAFDDLDLPGPGIAAARDASDTDILMMTISDDGALPRHVQAWLSLYLGLRDKDREGALVVLIGKAVETSNPDLSLLEYLETVAAIGGLSFIPSRRSVAHNSAPDHPPVTQPRMPWLLRGSRSATTALPRRAQPGVHPARSTAGSGRSLLGAWRRFGSGP